ncbi:MAG: hypothetical protein ACLGH1_11350 [Gammaproteobacteria bacterium]
MAKKKFSTALAQIIAEADSAPPDARVRIAANEHEETYALAHFHVWKAICLEDLTDEVLVELLEEGEMLETLTPLERELLVRLGARLELDPSA